MAYLIPLKKVASVYSGIDGKCCCGCAGKHTYAKAHQAWGGGNRGYAVDDDEVNDRVVKLIVGKLQALNPKRPKNGHRYVAATLGQRLYIAYLRP